MKIPKYCRFAPLFSKEGLACLLGTFQVSAEFDRKPLFNLLHQTSDQLCRTRARNPDQYRLYETAFQSQFANVRKAETVILAAVGRMAMCDAAADPETPLLVDNGVLRGIGKLHPHNFGPVASEMTLARYDRPSRLFGSQHLNDALHILSLNTDEVTKLSVDDATLFSNLLLTLGCCMPSTLSMERAPLVCVIERMRFCDRTLVHLRIAGLVADGETTAANAPVYSKAKTPDWRTQRRNRSAGTIAGAAKLPKLGQTERTKAKCTAECGLQSFA